MIKTVLVYLFLVSTYGMAQTNWTLSNSGVPSDFNTYDFIANGTAELYAVGSNFGGTVTPDIYKSTDNGSSWTIHNVNGLTSHDYLYSAGINTGSKYLLNAQDNMGNSAIYSSTDMTNWVLSNSGIPNNFNTFDFAVVDVNKIYAVGAMYNGVTYLPSVYVSTDSGITWNMLSSTGLTSYDYLYSASIYNGSEVLMNASNNTPEYALFRSSNGVSWTLSNNGLPSNFNTYDFIKIDNNNIWVVGATFNVGVPTPAIYVSSDGGVTWSSSTHSGMTSHNYLYSASKEFGSFLFVNASDGTGSYAIYRTDNIATISELNNESKELVKIVDLMGNETSQKPNTVLIYLYSDGSTEKRFFVE